MSNPWSASASAVARPMPRLAPVTSTVSVSSLFMSDTRLCQRGQALIGTLGIRVLIIPDITGQYRAQMPVNGRGAFVGKKDLLQIAPVPCFDESLENCSAGAQWLF